MEKSRLVCYGDSMSNLKMSVRYRVVGLRRPMVIDAEDVLYLVCKTNGIWTVYGRANIGDATLDNPFDEPEKYYTYVLDNIVACKPFGINEICKKQLGQYWGLYLQKPIELKNSELVKSIENSFVPISFEEFMK